jgi:hypothetical protein
VRPGYRELDALVLPDRTLEDLALLCPIRRPLDEETSVAHALGGDEDALGVHAVHCVPEALAFLTDDAACWDAEAFEE